MKSWFLFGLLFTTIAGYGQDLPSSARSKKAIAENTTSLEKEMAARNMRLGDPVFLRIFKKSSELEVWIQPEQSTKFRLFKTYKICHFSGKLGPKTKQGDGQSPEGFYFINAGRFNPWSSFHLSLNMGYPNAYDRSKGYTGDYLMIHGDCVSIGCYAITDESIEEIYTIAHKAVENGQEFFRVHAFPFRMTNKAMDQYANHPWINFWKNLKEGYKWFEERKIPPNVTLREGRYYFN